MIKFQHTSLDTDFLRRFAERAPGFISQNNEGLQKIQQTFRCVCLMTPCVELKLAVMSEVVRSNCCQWLVRLRMLEVIEW